MWIQSQDGQYLIRWGNQSYEMIIAADYYVTPLSNRGLKYEEVWTIKYKDIVMGQYESKERCIELLENALCIHNLKNEKNQNIYEMPQE